MHPILVFVAWMAMLSGWAALARDNGQWAQSQHRDWVESLRDHNGISCCNTADGYDVQWDTQGDKYRVFIDGTWYVVPPEAVLDDIPNRLGVARVWYVWEYDTHGTKTPKIRCFLPGSGT
jgi:hypothetical protein